MHQGAHEIDWEAWQKVSFDSEKWQKSVIYGCLYRFYVYFCTLI